MAKITFPGLEQYERQLSTLFKDTEQIAGAAIYAGADIVADAIKRNIGTLPQNPFFTAEHSRPRGRKKPEKNPPHKNRPDRAEKQFFQLQGACFVRGGIVVLLRIFIIISLFSHVCQVKYSPERDYFCVRAKQFLYAIVSCILYVTVVQYFIRCCRSSADSAARFGSGGCRGRIRCRCRSPRRCRRRPAWKRTPHTRSWF